MRQSVLAARFAPALLFTLPESPSKALPTKGGRAPKGAAGRRALRARRRADRGPLAFRRSTAALAGPAASSIGSAPVPRFLKTAASGVTLGRLFQLTALRG